MCIRDYGFEMTAEMGLAMVDDQKTTVRVRDSQNMAAVKEALRSEGLNIEEGCMLPEALHLSGYDYLGNVGPFADGRITAQDESAMLAAVAAGIADGESIIDVCAAPGGKSMHMADILKGSGQVSECFGRSEGRPCVLSGRCTESRYCYGRPAMLGSGCHGKKSGYQAFGDT